MFKNMTLGMRLGFGFGAILALLMAVAATGHLGSSSISSTAIDEFKEMIRTDAAVAEHGAEARAAVLGLRRFEKDLFLNIGSRETEEEYLKKWKEQHKHLLASLDGLEKAATLQQDRDSIKMMRSAMDAYDSGFGKVSEMVRAGKITTPQEGNNAIREYKDPIHKLEQAAASFSTEGNKRMANIEDDVKAAIKRTSFIMSILTLASVILGIIISALITRSVSRPLNRVIVGLTDGAEQVSSAADQVSLSSQALAEGTSEQASSLEETSTSLEEMSSMTRQNADHANQARAMMSEASAIVTKVDLHMNDMSKAVAEITRSSEETGKIIKTIDEIAFQTNLLALNAAVEAARAGEAGAGFAVVADEVRNLAMRASEAARNTSDLIEKTIIAVRKGNELTTATQEAFTENRKISQKIEQLVDEIATASEEQSQGISQVNRAVSEMDTVTQSTAASAEESAAASEELKAQAEQMKIFVQELASAVNGSSNRTASDTGVHIRGERTAAASSRVALPLPLKRAAGKGVFRAKKKATPEEVIPMEDGEFKDF